MLRGLPGCASRQSRGHDEQLPIGHHRRRAGLSAEELRPRAQSADHHPRLSGLQQSETGSIQQGSITLQFQDFSPQRVINVLTVVSPSGSTSSGLVAHASCASQSLSIVFREPQPSQSSFSAVVGQATTIDVQVTDGCGNLVGLGHNAAVRAVFTSGDSVTMAHIGNGIWQGSWRPLSPGTVPMQVVAFVTGSNGSLRPRMGSHSCVPRPTHRYVWPKIHASRARGLAIVCTFNSPASFRRRSTAPVASCIGSTYTLTVPLSSSMEMP